VASATAASTARPPHGPDPLEEGGEGGGRGDLRRATGGTAASWLSDSGPHLTQTVRPIHRMPVHMIALKPHIMFNHVGVCFRQRCPPTGWASGVFGTSSDDRDTMVAHAALRRTLVHPPVPHRRRLGCRKAVAEVTAFCHGLRWF